MIDLIVDCLAEEDSLSCDFWLLVLVRDRLPCGVAAWILSEIRIPAPRR